MFKDTSKVTIPGTSGMLLPSVKSTATSRSKIETAVKPKGLSQTKVLSPTQLKEIEKAIAVAKAAAEEKAIIGNNRSGTIYRTNPERGYGFISPDDYPNQIFFGYNQLESNYDDPKAGDGVVFDVAKDRKLYAYNIRPE